PCIRSTLSNCCHCSGPSLQTSFGVRERTSLPQPKSAEKRIGIVACTRMWRKRLELADVAAANNDVIGLERRNQPRHDVGDVTTPFLLAVALQAGTPHVVLEGGLLVGQMAELHRLHDAIDDHGRSKSRSQSQKQHLATPVASQSLHGGIIDELCRTAERG